MNDKLSDPERNKLYNRALLELAKSNLEREGYVDPSLSHASAYVGNLMCWRNEKNPLKMVATWFIWQELQHKAARLMYSRREANVEEGGRISTER